MRQEKTLDGAVEHDNLHMLIGFETCDDLIQLRNRLRAEDVERRMIEGHAPVRWEALLKADLTNRRCLFELVHGVLPVRPRRRAPICARLVFRARPATPSA